MKIICTVLRVCAGIFLCASISTASTISVSSGGDLQAALNNAQPGDTVALARGAVFTGTFTLPAKGGSSVITVRTAGDSDLPTAGQRIAPSNSPQLARIQGTSNGPAIQTAQGAHHWTLMLLEIAGNGGSDLVTLGDGSNASHNCPGYSARPRRRPCLHPRRRDEGPEARHRAQQRLDDDHGFVYLRHQGKRPGLTGHLRMERPGTIRHLEQLSGSRRRERALRRFRIRRFRISCRPTSPSAAISCRSRLRGGRRTGW